MQRGFLRFLFFRFFLDVEFLFTFPIIKIFHAHI